MQVGIKFTLANYDDHHITVFDGFNYVHIPKYLMANTKVEGRYISASVPMDYARRVGWIR